MANKPPIGQVVLSKEQLNGLVNLMSSGRLREAHLVATNLVRQFPNIPVIHNILGVINFHLGAMEQAIACFKQALVLKPDYDEVLNNIFGDDDDIIIPAQSLKIGRNELCPCGSEKKYKKCCL